MVNRQSVWADMQKWEFVLPPSRLTVAELSRITEVLGDIDRKAPIAVLGSTPEFREMLYRLGFINIYVFDKDDNFYRLTTNLIPYRVNEHFIHGDWLSSLSDFNHFFRIILSDLTMGNISYKDRKLFYDNIGKALCGSGLFIDKALIIDFPLLKLEDLYEKYNRLPINLRTINNFSCEFLFCSELLSINEIVDSSRFYDFIYENCGSEKIRFFCEKSQLMITPRNFYWYYGKSWDELKENYFAPFSKEYEVFIDADEKSPYYKKAKQFFLKKGR